MLALAPTQQSADSVHRHAKEKKAPRNARGRSKNDMTSAANPGGPNNWTKVTYSVEFTSPSAPAAMDKAELQRSLSTIPPTST